MIAKYEIIAYNAIIQPKLWCLIYKIQMIAIFCLIEMIKQLTLVPTLRNKVGRYFKPLK